MRKFLNALILISSLLLTQEAFTASASLLLARDFKAAKIQFSQEKRLYHYFSIHNEQAPETQLKLQSPEGRQQLIRERIQYATNKFWAPTAKINGLFAGEGLYLAVDPLISEEYGNIMVEFKVKPTSYYINLKKGVYLHQDTIRAIYKEGYKTLDTGDVIPESMRFSEMTLNAMLTPENRQFRKLVLSVLKAENIMLMEYNWRSELAAICGEESSTSAFIYIGNQEIFPEFSEISLVDIKDSYSLPSLSERETQAKYDSQQLLYAMKANSYLSSQEDKLKNSLQIYKTQSSLRTTQEALFGCEL